MSRYALINEQDIVDNIIIYDGESEVSIRKGCKLIASDLASIGDIYINDEFISNNPVLYEENPDNI
ncbi:TPA: hypothetical protein PXO57_004463 [Yersinia enterocolitica]|uniref:hypothetical protein n=1 Tax=Yersinia enterocolitica TaxID=630 RepID=UPI0025AA4776|nr:hypothetical protein [Yersinia enterocolitica]ELI8335757.1 hypothetical protein [Yersinia enterocolitica]EMA9253802.1 hypothetical protein [Yersinia enterocolitica]EMA9428618.1 hypothetical protein [Yersinia enterocolitica]MDN0100397.1 hypothetical protein [Yersinia enterocolitica]HDL6593176.1 hypothetical protein [Yersinia enterocolitica]